MSSSPSQDQGREVPETEIVPDSENSDVSQTDADITWSPGDGICPSTAEFSHCFQSKYDEWKKAASRKQPSNSGTLLSFTRALLNLVRHVPPFFHSLPNHVKIVGKSRSFLILKSLICIRTTEDSGCSQPDKSIPFLQCTGSPKPVTYRTKDIHPQASFCGQNVRSAYLTSVVLAWSYVISCRWVEILKRAGEDSQILHDRTTQIDNCFWDIVTQGRWKAHVKRDDGVFYSPWMMRREGDKRKK